VGAATTSRASEVANVPAKSTSARFASLARRRITEESALLQMTPGTRYPHAPITEAVIDIQAAASVPVEQLVDAVAGDPSYPTVEKLLTASGEMMFGSEQNTFATARAEHVGYLCKSGDGLHILQARSNGFTFSRLAEYSSWAEVSNEARRLWNKYRGVACPAAITRIALRYVNRLDIPLPVQDFSTYLRTGPQLSPDLPQGLSGYFMQLQLPMPNVQGACIIHQTIIEPPALPNTVSVVLDIDVYRTAGLAANEVDLWAQLEQLRHEKNHVFESCITDEARRLFQ
jgi:uncharacterized protein (TIGR04255 family)